MAEQKPERHRETRRLLSHGFSARALKDQEDVLRDYSDLFVAQIRKHSAAAAAGLNMKEVRAPQDEQEIREWTETQRAVTSGSAG